MMHRVTRRWKRSAMAWILVAGTAAGATTAWAQSPEVIESAQAQELIPEGDFGALLEEVEREDNARDQMELITIMAESYDFTAKQARDLVRAVKAKERVAAAVLLYEHTEQKKFFVVLAALDNKERTKVKRRLGLLDDDGKGTDTNSSEPVPVAMGKKDFKSLEKALGKMESDEARVTLLEAVVEANHFEAQQAYEIVSGIKRSDAKVEVAVLLYPRIVDPEKFFLVLSALDSDSDRRLAQRDLDIGYTDDEFVADVVGTVNPDAKKRNPKRKGTSGDDVEAKKVEAKKVEKPKIKPMGDAAFLDFKKQVASESFSDDKRSLVEMVASSNHFTTAQVRELLEVFSFEDDKVDVAALLYTRVVDRGNYYKVLEAFTFSSSKDELRQRLNL